MIILIWMYVSCSRVRTGLNWFWVMLSDGVLPCDSVSSGAVKKKEWFDDELRGKKLPNKNCPTKCSCVHSYIVLDFWFMFALPSLRNCLHGAESDADSSLASQEIARILWNLKVHYRIHNSPTLIPILRQINPSYPHPSCFFKIHFNIVFPSTFGYP